jgi:hypothetical protein
MYVRMVWYVRERDATFMYLLGIDKGDCFVLFCFVFIVTVFSLLC